MLRNHHKLKKPTMGAATVTKLAALGLCTSLASGFAWSQIQPVLQPGTASQLPVHTGMASRDLTLSEAVAFAMEGNLDLTVAKREIEAMQGQLLQSQMRPNPELAYTLEDQRAQSRTQSLQINLPIELGGKRAARIAAAEHGQHVAHEDLNVRRTEIRAAVVAAFFESLMAQERVLLAEDGVVLAQKAMDAVAKRVAAGKVSPVEEVKARVTASEARVALSQVMSERRSAKERLVALLGPNAPQFDAVVGHVKAFPQVLSAESVQRRLLDAPVLRSAKLEVERRKSLSDLERSKQVPDLTLSMGVKRSNDLKRDQLLFGVSIPLPFFDRNQGSLLEAVKREDKARDEFHAQTVRVRLDVMQARERPDGQSKFPHLWPPQIPQARPVGL